MSLLRLMAVLPGALVIRASLLLSTAMLVLSPNWRVLAQNAPRSEAEEIRKELQQLKIEYEQRIQRLEERLKLLEAGGTNGVESGSSPVTTHAINPTTEQPPGAVSSSRDLNRELNFGFQRPTESHERALVAEPQPWRERAEEVLEQFIDIHGYFRAGYGRSDEGGPQVAFQAPGALAKYRLGNEAENYGELAFGKSFYVPDIFKLDQSVAPGTPTGPIARVQVRMSMHNPYQDLLSSSSTDFGLPAAWGASVM
jgi:maltoporin